MASPSTSKKRKASPSTSRPARPAHNLQQAQHTYQDGRVKHRSPHDPLQIPELPKTESGAAKVIAGMIPYWRARPVSFVMQVMGTVPDAWQGQVLIHLADRPPSVDVLRMFYGELRDAYRYEVKRAHAAQAGAIAAEDEYALRKAKKAKALAEMNLRNSEHWESEEWLAEDFGKPFTKVSVKSGHGVGKSTAMAWAVLWVMACFYPLKGGATAPTAHQLEDVLWAEVYKWYDILPPWFRNQIKVRDSLRVENASKPKQSFIVGKTARKEQPEALQGLHQENTAVFVDEASGVPDIVFESSEGIMTAESTRAFLGANPTRLDGFFYDSHTRLSSWYTMTVNSEDWVPRVSQQYVEDCAARYGVDSNRYRVRVQGKFPRGDDDACVPRFMVDDAVEREVETYPNAAIVWGVDPAYMGDDRTALSKRKGNVKLGKTAFWTKQKTTETAGRIIKEYRETFDDEKPDDIVVDVNGIGGGVADQLEEAGLPVTRVNAWENSMEPERYDSTYSEIWWQCREWFEQADCSIPDEPEFIRELCRPRYKMLSTGKTAVERKTDVKKRVLEKQSPDLAESFVLTFRSRRASRRVRYKHRPLIRRPVNPLSGARA